MRVSEIMTHNIKQIDSEATLSEAASKMRKFDIGVLPVLHNEEIVGMITDRDIVVRGIASGLDCKKSQVRQIMTPQVLCCSQEDTIEEAGKLMEDNQVHRLVVLDSNNRMCGILSLGDIALKSGNEHLSFEVLEHICEPAHHHG